MILHCEGWGEDMGWLVVWIHDLARWEVVGVQRDDSILLCLTEMQG